MTDGAELRTTLEKLQQVLPLVTPRLDSLAKQAGEIEQRASALLGDMERADTQVQALLREIEIASRQLIDDAGGRRAAIVAEVDELAHAVLDLDVVEKSRDVLEQSAEAARAVMESLESRVDLGIEAVEQGSDGLHAALGGLKQETEEGGQALTSALGAAADAAAALREAIDAGRRSVFSTIDGMASEIAEVQQQAAHRIESGLSAADVIGRAFASRLDEAMNGLVGGPADALIREMGEKIAGELEERLDTAVGEVRKSLGALAKAATGARNGSAAGREKLKPLFDRVEGFVEPTKTVVDAIRDAADTVGIEL